MAERYTVLNRNNYPAGLHTFGPVDIPPGVESVRAYIARHEKQPNGTVKANSRWDEILDALNNQQDVIRFGIQISLDGGATWPIGVGGTTTGGAYILRDGSEAEFTTTGTNVPEPQNPNRKIKGFIETYEAMSTRVEVETLP